MKFVPPRIALPFFVLAAATLGVALLSSRLFEERHGEAAAVGLKAHTSIVRMLAGDHPVPINYIVVWRRWLGAPPGWPLLSWEVAERLFSRHG